MGDELNLPPVILLNLYLLERWWNPDFFVTFRIIIMSHAFPKNLIEIPQDVQ